MPTVDDIKNDLDDIEFKMAMYAPGGAVMAQYQGQYTELAQRKAELERHLTDLDGDAEPALTAEGVMTPGPDITTASTPTTPPMSASPTVKAEIEEPADFDSGMYEDFLRQAQEAQHGQRWDNARDLAGKALIFARGPQIAFIESLRKTIDRQQVEVAAAAADAETTRLMTEARELNLKDLYPAALEKARAAKAAARPERKADAQDLENTILRNQDHAEQTLLAQLKASLEEERLEDAQKQLVALRGVRPGSPALVEQTKIYNELWSKVVLARVIKEGTEEIERLLAPRTVADTRRARIRAQQLFGQHPGLVIFDELRKKATVAESEATDRWAYFTSTGATAVFGDVLDALEDAKAAGATALPTYQLKIQVVAGAITPILTEVGEAPPDEAINTLIRTIAAYSSDKAREYKARAEQELVSNPRTARQFITDALDFMRLPDGDKKALQDFLTQQVEGRVREREWVERECEKAKVLNDPLAAWTLVKQAAPRDPQAPCLEDVRSLLRPQVKALTETTLRKATEALAKESEWGQAEALAGQMRDLLEGDAPLAELYQQAAELTGQAVRLQQIKGRLARQKTELDSLVQRDPAAAEPRIATLIEDAGRLAAYFPDLALWSDSVKSRRDWRGALAEVEAGYRDLSETALGQRVERLNRLRITATTADLDELNRTERRLNTRSKYLRAEQLYNSGGSFRDDAEPLLREVVREGTEDAKAAQTSLDEIAKIRAEAECAKQELETTEALEKNRNYEAAIKNLEPYQNQDGELGQKIRQRVRDLSAKWQASVERQLNVLKDAAKLPSLEDVENKVTLFKKLAPVPGGEWEETQMPDIYARAARVARDAGGSGYAKAQQLLDKALGLAPDRTDLQTERREVTRLVVRQLVGAMRTLPSARIMQGLADAETKWNEFAHRYPGDVESFIERGKLAIEQGNYELALRYLDAALGYSQEQGGAQFPTINALHAIAEEHWDVKQTQAKIRKLLVKNNDAHHYKTAQSELEQLTLRHQKRKAEFQEWMIEQQEALANTLSQDLLALPTNADERWLLALKITILNPQSQEAGVELGRAIQEVEDLKRDTAALLADMVGPVKSETMDANGEPLKIEASQALNVQIEEARKLATRAYRITQILDQQALMIKKDDSHREEAKECRGKIQTRLRQLDALEALIRQGRGQLAAARGRAFIPALQGGDDPFKTVSETLGDIVAKDVSFDKHRTVTALRRDVLNAMQCRTDLLEEVKRLETAVQVEDFEQVLASTNKIHDLDPMNDFDAMSNVRIYDPFLKQSVPIRTTQRHDSIEKLAQVRQAQWEKINAWQEPMGLLGWERGKTLPANCLRLIWEQDVAQRCSAAWATGGFSEARKLIEDALGTEHNEAGALAPKWSLRRCQSYLAVPRLKDAPLTDVINSALALSDKARKVCEARVQALDQVIADIRFLEEPRPNGTPAELDRLKLEEERFYAYMEAIGEGLARLQARRFIIQAVRGADRDALCQDVRDNVKAAQRIAPRYPGLLAVIPSVLEQCPGGDL